MSKNLLLLPFKYFSRLTYLFSLMMLLFAANGKAQSQIEYPYPVRYIIIFPEGKPHQMAFMDVNASASSNKTIVLLHGKNFNGYYWKDVIPALVNAGYRVVVPDQLGWGKSSRPILHYSFHMLAQNTKALLDSLNVKQADIVGHSMGGMLATRFTLMFPDVAKKLILENPIGLEDYKTFVPYQTLPKIFEKEKKGSYESYKKYQQTYYPAWKTEYEQYVQAQAADLSSTDFENIAWVNALTYQMIYEQPVVYEFANIKKPTFLIIGNLDRTVVGKDQLPEEARKKYGRYPTLAKKLNEQIKGSKLMTFQEVGHIPHIQENKKFNEALLKFLEQ